MYKLSVPIPITTFTEQNLKAIIKELKEDRIDRVFLTGFDPIYIPESPVYTQREKTLMLIKVLREEGFEVGIWFEAFGHGEILSHALGQKQHVFNYVRIEGADGTKVDAFCPLDENFKRDYSKGVKAAAELLPDIIMLDDDYRLDTRYKYYMGCCCELHMKSIYKKLGEVFPREDIEQYVFTGGKNKYRDAWLSASRDSLVDLAVELRKIVDSVDPNIRLGSCSTGCTWDYSGTDNIELAKAFAGKTKPFVRSAGAPYHGLRLMHETIEKSRMQAFWAKDTGVELFTEGDVYPRPCYNTPSSYLEIFDLALLATGETDGCLKYIVDYTHDYNYEQGYISHHKRNLALRSKIEEMFSDKKAVGVRVCEIMRTIENRTMPDSINKGDTRHLKSINFSSNSYSILAENAIPTMYEGGGEYPVIAYGENAKYLTEEDLKNGAILDVDAAKYLSQKGIDTGFISCEKSHFTGERFVKDGEKFYGINDVNLQKIVCDPKAVPLSYLLPDESIGSYLYENANGQRFMVLAYRADLGTCNNYLNTYSRQEQLIDSVKWLCGKELPAVCTKNPFLYIITSKNHDKTKMSVALFNIFADPIIAPKVVLDSENYTLVSTANCEANIEHNTVTLSDLPAFGIAAFEVKLK